MHIFLFLCFGFLGVSLATPGSPNSTPLNAVPSSSNTFITLTSQSTKTPPVSYVTTTSKVPITVSSIIPSKTAVPDCNYQGLPSTLLLEHDIGASYTSTILACQTACEDTTGCESYQYRSTENIFFENCHMFNVRFNSKDEDGIPLTILSHVSGIYYSNRWPSDGSGHCYG